MVNYHLSVVGKPKMFLNPKKNVLNIHHFKSSFFRLFYFGCMPSTPFLSEAICTYRNLSVTASSMLNMGDFY
jgi:hypothetical protein